MAIKSRADLKNYCLQKCGSPVIDVNVADEQIENAIDDAMDFYQEYHFNGTENSILAHQVTQNELDNKVITLPDSVISVTDLLNYGSDLDLPGTLFDVEYYIKFDQAFSASSGGLQNYYLLNQYISLINDVLNGVSRYRFNRVTHELYIDNDWYNDLQANDYIVMEVYKNIDPDTHPEIYGEWVLRELAAAHLKYQWGVNLSKFTNIELPGGVSMNGDAITQQAREEIENVKREFIMRFQEPDGFTIA